MRKKKVFFAVALLCLSVAALWGYYWYKKPRQSAGDIKAAYTLSAAQLYNAYAQNEKAGDSLYSDKVVQVQGMVAGIEQTDSTATILLAAGEGAMGGVNCSLAANRSENKSLPAKGATVSIKGISTGYLMDVNIADAVIVSTKKE